MLYQYLTAMASHRSLLNRMHGSRKSTFNSHRLVADQSLTDITLQIGI